MSVVAENTDTKNFIQEGDVVLLWFRKKSYLVRVEAGKKHAIHVGRPLECDDWIGKEWGSTVQATHEYGYLMKPSTEDLMMKAMRESGVVYPKDAAFLAIKLGIQSGYEVLEIGTGSGSLTMHLARTVAPTGKVYTYDRRTDLPVNAKKNITRASLDDYVEFRQRERQEELPENAFDVAILDIPTPWEEVEVVKKALRQGGRICCLNPTLNQVEKMAEAMHKHGFVCIQSFELLEREMLAREGRSRPVQRMVGHTEYMLFGMKVADAPTAEETENESSETKDHSGIAD